MKKNKLSRRSFLFLTGATGAGGVMFTHGMDMVQHFVPFINPPDHPKPGEWAFYSTTCRECPAGCGMVMWHRDGRVTKAEGNPMHPLNRGKLCIRGQSSVQGEYNPGRLKKVLKKDRSTGLFEENTWEQALISIKKNLSVLKPVLISDLQTGSLAGVMNDFATLYGTKPLWYEAFNYESLRLAYSEIYGTNRIPRINIDECDLILSFGVDFLQTWLSPVEYAVNFSKIHSPDKDHLGEFIYFGPAETMTALNADQFIVIQPGSEVAVILKIALSLKKKGAIRNMNVANFLENISLPLNSDPDDGLIEKITEKIIQAKSPVILAGRPEDRSSDGIKTVKAACLLNELLGNSNRIDFSQYHALSHTAYQKEIWDQFRLLSENDMLIIHKTNPVYSEPGIEKYFKKAGMIVYIGPEQNETSEFADWILPSNYPLEDWGDFEPWNGTVSLLQPVMRPLFDTMSSGDIFLRFITFSEEKKFKNVVLENWNKWKSEINSTPEVSEIDLNESVRRSHIIRKAEEYNPDLLHLNFDERETENEGKGLSLNVVPSLFFYDGRLAGRAWLQEIPDAVTGIVWQSWLDLNPETGKSLNVADAELVKVITPLSEFKVPVRLTTKVAKNTISIQTGQGHWKMNNVANKVGVNAFSLMNRENSTSQIVVKIEKTGKFEVPIYLNNRGDQYDRDLLKWVHFNKSIKPEDIIMPLPEGYNKERDLYSIHEHKKHRWAMVIDLQSCIGCRACEAACYAENNIPVVGRSNCFKGLEMSWLKIVNYKIAEDRIAFLPLPCQHCDAAPCEPVCPVYAASHNEEGLNAQIYNRCVGTRYCSNNCPYKVRRFNWKNIMHDETESLQLNPEVTVRCRGVMEKCTFCVQRIRYVEYAAKKGERKIKDGEIIPACAQTCPTNAIIFGDLLDENSQVSKLFNHERRYQLLQDLNTKPAVVYLKKILL
jgi:molybdopterin-containing oxidoreductase family iron-sulfur binding subunit